MASYVVCLSEEQLSRRLPMLCVGHGGTEYCGVTVRCGRRSFATYIQRQKSCLGLMSKIRIKLVSLQVSILFKNIMNTVVWMRSVPMLDVIKSKTLEIRFCRSEI